MNITIFLEIVCSLLFLVNKILLLVLPKDKRLLIWGINLPASIIAIWIFLSHEPKLFGLAILQMFGFFLTIRAMFHPKKRKANVEKIIPALTLLFVIVFVFSNKYQGFVSVLDVVTTAVFIFGTFGFGYETVKGKTFGWFFYFIGHLISIKLAYIQQTPYMMWGQILSMVVAYVAITKLQIHYAKEYAVIHKFPREEC